MNSVKSIKINSRRAIYNFARAISAQEALPLSSFSLIRMMEQIPLEEKNTGEGY